MKNFLSKFKWFILGGILTTAGVVGAINISVPSASGPGFLLQSTSTGAYLPVSLTAGTNITFSTTTSNITIGWWGLSTTSQPASSNLLVSNGGAGVYGVATSVPTVTAPITYSGTLGSFVGGVGGAFDCTSATASVKGCLTNTDFTTFNAKLGSYDNFTHSTINLPNSATTSKLAIGTTTPYYSLVVASTTGAQLALGDGVAGNSLYTFRTSGNNLYISTTTVAGTATSTDAAVTVSKNGYLGVGTTSPMSSLSVKGNVDVWGRYAHYGDVNNPDSTYCKTTSYCLTLAGNDNTLAGVNFEAYNSSNGASAYSVYSLNNDLTDNTGLHYAALSLNSSGYNDNTFGTGLNIINDLQLVNSDGVVQVIAATSTSAGNIQFLTGGVTLGATGIGNERMRIDSTGNVTMATTTDTNISVLTIASTTQPQIGLSAGAGQSQWVLRNAGGSLFLATTTIAGTATSSQYSLSISSSTNTLNVNGISLNTGNAVNSFTGTGLTITSGSLTNSGVISGSCSNGIVCSGTNPLAISGFTFPFTTSATGFFNQVSNGTSTQIHLSGSPIALSASSTSVFDNASTTLFTLLGTSNGCAQFTNSGLLSSTGIACGSASGLTSYDAWSHLYFGGVNVPSYSATTSQMAIGTSTASVYELTIASSTVPQIALSDRIAGDASWTFRNAGANLYFATTTVAGTATTTNISALSLLNNGNIGVASTSPGSLLSIGMAGGINLGISTSTFGSGSNGINITNGCFAINLVCVGGGSGTGITSYDAWTHSTINLPNSATTSKIAIGTTTPYYSLTVASTTGPQIALSDGTAGIAQWVFRNAGGNFYLSTTTVAGNATTSTAALSVIGSSGNVGIATTTPFGVLSIDSGSAPTNPMFVIGSGSGGTNLQIATSTQSLLMIGTTSPYSLNPGGGAPSTQTAPGRVVIATTTTPQISLIGNAGEASVNLRSIGGAFYISTSSTNSQATTTLPTLGFHSTGVIIFGNYSDCTGTGNFLGVTTKLVTCDAIASDARLKTNIKPVPYGLDLILAVEPKSWFWKDNHLDGLMTGDKAIQYGLVAQDLQKVAPELVTKIVPSKYTPDGTLTYNHDVTDQILWNAVRELAVKSGIVVKRSAEENWQDILIGLLVLGFIYQQIKINKLKKHG